MFLNHERVPNVANAYLFKGGWSLLRKRLSIRVTLKSFHFAEEIYKQDSNLYMTSPALQIRAGQRSITANLWPIFFIIVIIIS